MADVTVQTLMQDVKRGRVVLPDFQRGFVWKPDDVQELLVSVLGSYYIGSILYLQTLEQKAPFALKLVEGVSSLFPDVQVDSIVEVLLDGQQRTSSLFYAMFAPPLQLSGRKSPYRFFASLPHVLSADWQNAVDFVNVSNTRRLKVLQASPDHVAFTDFFEVGELTTRFVTGKYQEKAAALIQAVNNFNNYKVQTVTLDRETPLHRVVETFERINKTGIPLGITDLLVAKLYREKVKLRELIATAESKYDQSYYRHTGPDFILRVMSLLRDLDVRRNTILELSAKDFEKDWDNAAKALALAFKRMTDLKHYAVIDFGRWSPFSTMLVPLAGMIAQLQSKKQDNAKNYAKLDEWYWATVFSNRYNEGVNTNTVSDFKWMAEWFSDDAKVPAFIRKFNAKVDLQIDSRTSATYRGVFALVVRRGALDFKTGESPSLEVSKIQDDHVFPKSKFKVDAIWNRTLISSNAEKSDKRPSEYFNALLVLGSRQKLLEILSTHLIDEKGLEALLSDEIDDFQAARTARIQEEIGNLVPSRSAESSEGAEGASETDDNGA